MMDEGRVWYLSCLVNKTSLTRKLPKEDMQGGSNSDKEISIQIWAALGGQSIVQSAQELEPTDGRPARTCNTPPRAELASRPSWHKQSVGKRA
jgi:hypothetical protein